MMVLAADLEILDSIDAENIRLQLDEQTLRRLALLHDESPAAHSVLGGEDWPQEMPAIGLE